MKKILHLLLIAAAAAIANPAGAVVLLAFQGTADFTTSTGTVYDDVAFTADITNGYGNSSFTLYLPGLAHVVTFENPYHSIGGYGSVGPSSISAQGITLDSTERVSFSISGYPGVGTEGTHDLTSLPVVQRSGTFVTNSIPLQGQGPLTINSVSVTNAPDAPEPQTWALMIVGFGLIGAGMRRTYSRQQPLQMAVAG